MFWFFVQYNKTTYNVWVIYLQYVEICSEFDHVKYILNLSYGKQIKSNLLKCQNTKIMQLLSKYLICKFIYFSTSPEFKVQRFRFWFYTTETHCKNTNGHLMYLQTFVNRRGLDLTFPLLTALLLVSSLFIFLLLPVYHAQHSLAPDSIV